ncbi:MAG TPA: lytic transglycosylase domain-containing protein [Deltaproteobacteria bacterium]|nr:lytic transglycosylase domain-containing protein [Deltaproteobacteria bacterium]
MNKAVLIIVLFAAATLPVPSGLCDIYTYVDENGVRHFTNVPHLASVRYNVYITEPSTYPPKASVNTRYDHLIAEASRRFGVNEPLLKAMIKAESNFDPRAVSKKGAKGLMQLMPENIRAFRVSDPFNPRENIMAGTRYFKRMINRYGGKLSFAIAAYNAGPEKVDQYRRVPPFIETQDFVERVLSYYRVFQKG